MKSEERHIIDELKKRPAEVPGEEYFAGLKAVMLEKIAPTSEVDPPPQSGSKEGAPAIPLYRKHWFQIAAAASVALIITLFARYSGEEPHTPMAQTHTPDWNSVSQEEVLAYIDAHIDDFETEAIAQHLDSIPVWSTGEELAVNTPPAAKKVVKATAGKYDELFKDIDQEDILEYLENEGELDEDLLF